MDKAGERGTAAEYSVTPPTVKKNVRPSRVVKKTHKNLNEKILPSK